MSKGGLRLQSIPEVETKVPSSQVRKEAQDEKPPEATGSATLKGGFLGGSGGCLALGLGGQQEGEGRSTGPPSLPEQGQWVSKKTVPAGW